MKILAIISSLRKKNTYNTIKLIEETHQALYPCEYEYFFLKKANLKTCVGCHLCLTRGEQYCPLKDDRDTIIARIESSDAVILASPNHMMNVNWLMKNFIDRFAYLLHRPRFFQQRFMILITSGSYPGIKEAIKALSPIASGGKVISRLGIMNSPGMNESKKQKEEKKTLAGAKKFATAMQKDYQFSASFSNMLWFAAFKATAGIHTVNYPADSEYYKGKRFFIKTRLNTYQRATISLLTDLFSFLIKIGLV